MRTRSLLSLSLVLFTLPGLLHADPPDRVARLGYFTGSVSFRSADLDEWAPASANYPLTEGDHLWTDDDARGELHVGGSTVVRLAPRTAFSFLNLDDDTAQMRISEGCVLVTIGDLDRNEVVEVDTPGAAVSLLERGFYRVEVGENGYETIVTVRSGEAEVTAGGASVVVHSGDALVIRGGDSPRYDVRDADRADDWEDWALDRDRRDERAESRRYVSSGVIGYQDLDDHGRWRDDAEYGHVWVPTYVAASWAPYRYGHWAFVQPWGWTWIDDAPWGFAPFHYGRWAHRPWGWCWVPGAAVRRPVYAPALVAFIGGEDFSVTVVAGGGVGWFPLGPREAYVPPYAASPGYIRNVNVTHVTNITNINVTNINVNEGHYMNRGAVTVVNNEVFVRSRPVAGAAVSVPTQALAHARVRQGVVATIKPRRESILGAEVRTASVRMPPVSVQERAVVTRVKPPVPRARVVVEGARPAAVRGSLVKPAVEQDSVRLRPAREGLPEAHAVHPGERPRAVEHREDRPAAAKPYEAPRPDARPTARPRTEERNDRPVERGNDRPATPRPTTTKPYDRPQTEQQPTTRPATPKPYERPVERGNDRTATPRPTATRPHERPHPDDQPTTRPVTKPYEPYERPRSDERPTTQPHAVERGGERTGASKPEEPERVKESPSPTPRSTRESEKAKDKAKDKSKDKSKASPTATPSPKPRDRR